MYDPDFDYFGGFIQTMKSVGKNEVTPGEGFHISYQPTSDVGKETALVDTREHKARYYILLGDFREQYKPLIPKGFEACRAFFDAQDSSLISPWSDGEMEKSWKE